VLDSTGALATYATDASNYRYLPLGVVIPRCIDDLKTSVIECAREGIPVLVRGAGTSLAGQACNEAVIIDTSRHLDRVLRIKPTAKLAIVEPGVALQHLNDRLAEFGLCFAPDPSTKDVATLGGMYANNSCGVRSVRYGPTVANVRAVRGLTSDGHEFAFRRQLPGEGPPWGTDRETLQDDRVLQSSYLADSLAAEIKARFPKIPRRISGYNLDDFSSPIPDPVRGLCGNEGTLAVVTELELTLVDLPRHLALAVLAFPNIVEAAAAVPSLLETKPVGLEAIDGELADRCRLAGIHADALDRLPSGAAWLLVEVDGDSRQDALDAAHALVKSIASSGRPGDKTGAVFTNGARESIWRIRKSALAMATLNPKGPREWVGWEDAAVPPENLAPYLESFMGLARDYGLSGTVFGHFGDGCVHTHLSFDFVTQSGREAFARFLRDAAELVVDFGGSLSGEHGDGQARGALLETMFGSRLVDGFRKLKKIWDPAGVLNPNRVVDAPPPTASLLRGFSKKLTANRRGMTFGSGPLAIAEEFDRCVGAGVCVRKSPGPSGGTMCPTYMATLDERHSTRGRARLLYEMAVGQSITGGWQDDEVAEALELCIGCKACKSECPAAVDMAAYRTEYFYQRYGALGLGRRSLSDLFLGLSPFWLRATRPLPLRIVARHASGSRRLRQALGLADDPETPTLSIPATRGSRLAPPQDTSATGVIVWPDCFSVDLDSAVYESALQILSMFGIQPVHLRPDTPSLLPLCCARPFIETAMVGIARRILARAVRVLRSRPYRDLPVVFLEPSCLSVFRSELLRLVPASSAEDLESRAFSLSEAIVRFGKTPDPSRMRPRSRKRPAGSRGSPDVDAVSAAVFLHCHQRALWGADAERALLNAVGIESEFIEGGCCGMAGKFGLSKSTLRLSRQIYDRQVRHSVERVSRDTILVADGFSCRHRLAASQSRPVVHTAELIDRRLNDSRR
jgi:FAD/FMN-containing dehydrogenase/Fe-S oxidoreductase